jgi:hypothetical protein
MIFLLTLPIRAVLFGFKLGTGSMKLTHRTIRLLGYRRLFFLGTGIAVGLLIAPTTGAELRAKLAELLEGLQGTAPVDLAANVRDELASSPRTWHLPQPDVAIETGRVTLTGEVPHATAAADLERTVRAVKGVVDVDNRLRIAGA